MSQDKEKQKERLEQLVREKEEAMTRLVEAQNKLRKLNQDK